MSLHLFGHQESGHAYKVALAMNLAGLDYAYTWVDIRAPAATRPAEFLKNSPLAQVPLLMDGAAALTQSGAILMHLAETRGVLGGDDATTMHRAREVILWEANRIGMVVPQLIAEKREGGVGFGEQTVSWLRRRYDEDLVNLEKFLLPSGFLAGDGPTIGDVAVFGYLHWHRLAGLEVTPKVEAWFERIRSLPRFVSVDDCLPPG